MIFGGLVLAHDREKPCPKVFLSMDRENSLEELLGITNRSTLTREVVDYLITRDL